jgi:hypothetical protein
VNGEVILGFGCGVLGVVVSVCFLEFKREAVMRLFKQFGRRGGERNDWSAGQERAAERIAGAILCRQRKVADYLNGKASRVSGRSWFWWLLVFCLLSGLYFGWLVVKALV